MLWEDVWENLLNLIVIGKRRVDRKFKLLCPGQVRGLSSDGDGCHLMHDVYKLAQEGPRILMWLFIGRDELQIFAQGTWGVRTHAHKDGFSGTGVGRVRCYCISPRPYTSYSKKARLTIRLHVSILFNIVRCYTLVGLLVKLRLFVLSFKTFVIWRGNESQCIKSLESISQWD